MGYWLTYQEKKLGTAILENNVNIQKQPLQVFYKKGALKSFAIFIGKHIRWIFFLINLFQHTEAVVRRCSST